MIRFLIFVLGVLLLSVPAMAENNSSGYVDVHMHLDGVHGAKGQSRAKAGSRANWSIEVR